nr:hypothetical protein [Microvenator marinus]
MKAWYRAITSLQISTFEVLVVPGFEIRERIQVCDTMGTLFGKPYLVASKLALSVAGRKQICIVCGEDQLRISGIRFRIVEEPDEFRRKCWMKPRLELVDE